MEQSPVKEPKPVSRSSNFAAPVSEEKRKKSQQFRTTNKASQFGNKGRNLTDVLFEGPLKSYKQFVELHTEEGMSTEELLKAYENYKIEHSKKQARSFFSEHKNDEWFREKYDPFYIEQKKNYKVEWAKKQLQSFEEELNQGSLKWNLSTDLASKHDDHHSEENEEGHSLEVESEKKEGDQDKSNILSPHNREYSAIFIKNVTPTIGKKHLLEFFQSFEGFVGLSLSLANPPTFNRLAWVVYQTKDQCYYVIREVDGKKINEVELQLAMNKTLLVEKSIRLAPPFASTEHRIQSDLSHAKGLCIRFDREKDIVNPLLASSDFESLPTIEQLDKLITYLRRVHIFCYYCTEDYDSEYEMHKKCAIQHMRSQKDEEGAISPQSEKWLSYLEHKVKDWLQDRPTYDVLTGKTELSNQLERFYKDNIVRKDKDKFRCAECNKLFCGENFVIKHLNLKHGDLIDIVKRKAYDHQFFENYFRDPKKFTPSHTNNGVLPIPNRTSSQNPPIIGRNVPPSRSLISPPHQPGWSAPNVPPVPSADHIPLRPPLFYSPVSSTLPYPTDPYPPFMPNPQSLLPTPPTTYPTPLPYNPSYNNPPYNNPPFNNPPYSNSPYPSSLPSHNPPPPRRQSSSFPRGVSPGRSRPSHPPPHSYFRASPVSSRNSRSFLLSPSLRSSSTSSKQTSSSSSSSSSSHKSLNYVDCDAPREESVSIDYRSHVDYSEL